MFYCARERRLALTRTLRSAATFAATFWSSSPEGSAAPASVFNEIVLRAALRLRSHYLDLSSHLTKNPFKVEQFRYTTRFEEKNRAAAINAGVAPGLTNLLVKRAADMLDEVHSVPIRLYESSESEDRQERSC